MVVVLGMGLGWFGCVWVGLYMGWFYGLLDVVFTCCLFLFLRYVGLVIVHVGVGEGGVASGGWVPAYLSLGALDGNRGDEVGDAVM